MYGSGVTIGIPVMRARSVWFAAAVGPTARSTAELPFASTAPRTSVPTALVSGLASPQVSSELRQERERVLSDRAVPLGEGLSGAKGRADRRRSVGSMSRKRGMGIYPHRIRS